MEKNKGNGPDIKPKPDKKSITIKNFDDDTLRKLIGEGYDIYTKNPTPEQIEKGIKPLPETEKPVLVDGDYFKLFGGVDDVVATRIIDEAHKEPKEPKLHKYSFLVEEIIGCIHCPLYILSGISGATACSLARRTVTTEQLRIKPQWCPLTKD